MVLNVAMNTVTEIFDEMGGPTSFARALGLKPSAASEMKRRNSIPVAYWPELIRAAKTKRKRLTYEQLVEAHQKPAASAEAAQ